jgi:Dolichyl-phosphate-mannose-protein mannosyltransferase
MRYKRNDRQILSPETLACFIVCSLGIFLRMWQYSANRSLWVDEAKLASNIVNRSFAGLMAPLDSYQGAPIAFLFTEKALIELLGNHDYVLRLFPLLASILAVFLMWRVAEIYIGGWGSLFALSFFVICNNLIYYASEVKQYSIDVMSSLLLLMIIPMCLDSYTNPKRLMLFGFFSGVLVWFSHPAVFIISSGFLVLILDILKSKEPQVTRLRKLLWLAGAGAFCFASFSVLYLTSLRTLSAHADLLRYWRDGFMPLPPWRDVNWFREAWYGLLSGVLGLSLEELATIIFTLGCVSLFLKRWQFALIVIMPLIVTLLVSGMNKYPFKGRLMLFSIPILVLLVAEGIERARLLLMRVGSRTAIFVVVTLTAFLLYNPLSVAWGNFLQPPMREHIKPAMSYLDQNRLSSDIIYVYYSTISPFKYYASAFGFHEGDYVEGIQSRKEPEKYLHDIERFRNRDRVWFIFSHKCKPTRAMGPGDACSVDEESFFLRHLDTLGSRVAVFQSEGVSLYLYNLTNPKPEA